MSFPLLAKARVIAVDPANHQLTVSLSSTQVAVVKVSLQGPADGIRVNQNPLPTRGTTGIVAFIGGDRRNGVWLCSHYSSFMDARPTNDDPHVAYHSHWSGYYDHLDQNGRYTQSFPDGTYLTISDTTDKPTLYRHTVDVQQNVNLTEFTDEQRVPSPPSPRHVYLGHSSGTSAHIDPTGNTSVTGASGATATLSFGGTTAVIDNNGNMTVTGKSGAQYTVNYNDASLQISSGGDIVGNAAPGHHFKLSSGGAAAQYTLVRTDLLVNWLNNHTHTGVTAGPSNTGTPTTPVSAGDIQSTLSDVSE